MVCKYVEFTHPDSYSFVLRANPVNECPYLFIACADGHLKMLRIHKDPVSM